MSKENLIDIGKRLKAIRTALRIKQKDMAEALDIAGCYLSELETGKANPCHAFFYKLSTRFDVSLDYLFHGEGEMFRAEKEIKEKEKDLDDDKTMNPENLMRLIEISPLFRYQVLGFAAKFRYDNDSIIKQDIENSLAKLTKTI